MSAPALTLPLVTSVHNYFRFRRMMRAALEGALRQPDLAPHLAGLSWGPQTEDEGEERFGYTLRPASGVGFVFVGTYAGPETVVPEVPDLYFFVELPRGSAEQEEADARAEDIRAALAPLNRAGTQVFWGYSPGGTHGVWAVMTFIDVLRGGNPTGTVTQFVSHTLSLARDSGLLSLYLGPSFGPAARADG